MRLQRTASSAVPSLARLSIGLLAVGLAAGGCTSGTPGSSGPATTGAGATSGPISGPTSGTTGTTTVSQDDVRATAERLLGRATLPPGARRVTKAPSKQLRQPPDSPGVVGSVVTVSRYWVVDEPASQVRRWLATHRPASTTSNGSGSTYGPGAPRLDYTDFDVSPMPAGYALDSLSVATVALSPTRTAVGVFATTLAQPARPAWSVVPTSGATVTISWRIASGGTPARKVITGAEATPYVRAFDALTVSTMGVHPCPMMVAGSQVGLSLHADGRTWTTSLTNCPPLQVQQGRSTVQLNSGDRLYALVKRVIGREPGILPLHKQGTMTPLARTPRTPQKAK